MYTLNFSTSNLSVFNKAAELLSTLNETDTPAARAPRPAPKETKEAAKPISNIPFKKTEAEVTPPAVSYETVKEVTLAVIRTDPVKGREAALGLLGKFGAKLAPDLKPEQYPTYLKEAFDILSPTTNPAQYGEWLAADKKKAEENKSIV